MSSPYSWDDDELTPAQPVKHEPRAKPMSAWDKMCRSLGLRYQSVCPACNGAGHLTITQRVNS